MKPDQRERLTAPGEKVDPTTRGYGGAGVLPRIPNIGNALAPLDEAMSGVMHHEYLHGVEKGQTTHNLHLDPYFKWMPGYTNIITGWGGHGKSQLFFELLLIRAVLSGKKSIVWPSENLPARRFYNSLIHILTGKPVERTFNNCLTWDEYKRAQGFIREHILAIDPPTGMPYAPADILAYFEAGIEKMGTDTAHCLYDPWNKGDHTAKFRKFGGSDDAYIGHTLGLCTKWSQDTRQCLVITAHPKRPSEGMKYGETRPVPTGGHIAGGQQWENMAHYVGAMHRPFHHLPGSTAAAFYCHKCKDERNVAAIGSVGAWGRDGLPPAVRIEWDQVSNRYRWGSEQSNPLDAEDIKKIWQTPKATQATLLMPSSPPAVGVAPAPALVATVAPATLPPLTVASEFDAPSEYETLPPDRLPNGARAIRLPHNN